MIQIRPVIRLFIIAATLVVAIYVSAVESQENKWSFTSTALADTVPEIAFKSDVATGEVGVTRQPVIIAIADSTITLASSLALDIQFEPSGAGIAFADAATQNPLSEGELKIEAEQTFVKFYVEWLNDGQITLIAKSKDGEQQGKSVSKVFSITPAKPTKINVDSKFIGRNNKELGPSGFDYELTITQTDVRRRPVDFAAGETISFQNIDEPEDPVEFEAPGNDIADGSIVTLSPSPNLVVKLRIPKGEATLNLTVEKDGLPPTNFKLTTGPVSVKAVPNTSHPTFDDTNTSTPFFVQYLNRYGNPLTIDTTLNVVAELFNGSNKISELWVRLPNKPKAASNGVFTPLSSNDTYTIQFEEGAPDANEINRNLKLCLRFESVASDNECVGLELNIPQGGEIASSKGGVTLKWQPSDPANAKSQEYFVTVSTQEDANFDLTVEKRDQFRRTIANPSIDGSAEASLHMACNYLENGDDSNTCAIRIWINPFEEFEEMAIFDISVSTADAPDIPILSAQFDARNIGKSTTPSEPSANLKHEDATERIYIIPNVEDGGSEQRFLISYKTNKSDKLDQIELTFEEWTAFRYAISGERLALIWEPSDLEKNEKITEFSITASNDQGYGEQIKGKTPSGGMLSGINWRYVIIVSIGLVAVVSALWTSWIISRKRQSDRWLKSLEIAHDSYNSMHKYVNDPNSRDTQLHAKILVILLSASIKKLKDNGGPNKIEGREQILELAGYYEEFNNRVARSKENEITKSDEIIRKKIVSLNSINQKVTDAQQQKEDLDLAVAGLRNQNSKLKNKIDEQTKDIDALKEEFNKERSEYDQNLEEHRKTELAELEIFKEGKQAEQAKIDADIKTEIDRIESEKQNAYLELDALTNRGYQQLLKDAVSAISSKEVLDEMIETGSVTRTVKLRDLITKLSQMQDDGLHFSTPPGSDTVSMSHPVVNDLSSMRRLVTSSLEAFGAWLLSSTKYEQKPLSSNPTPGPNMPDAMISELANIDTRFNETGFGIASGLQKIVELSIDRIGNQSKTDDRARSYDEQAFWNGVSEAVNMLTSSALADVYPEFNESLGLNDDEIKDLEIGSIDAGPADALAKYVISDWFAQRNDAAVISIASTTLTKLEEIGADQKFTAYHFKQNVINNLVIRWGGRQREEWSVAQSAGFSIVCDYIIRYSKANLNAPWSNAGKGMNT